MRNYDKTRVIKAWFWLLKNKPKGTFKTKDLREGLNLSKTDANTLQASLKRNNIIEPWDAFSFALVDYSLPEWIRKIKNMVIYNQTMKEAYDEIGIHKNMHTTMTSYLVEIGEIENTFGNNYCNQFGLGTYGGYRSRKAKSKNLKESGITIFGKAKKGNPQIKPCPFLNPVAYEKRIGFDKPLQIQEIKID